MYEQDGSKITRLEDVWPWAKLLILAQVEFEVF